VLAIKFPKETSTIIMDGMDQKKTFMPSAIVMPKNVEPLKTHLLGIKVRIRKEGRMKIKKKENKIKK
jgi:hypothetical protein